MKTKNSNKIAIACLSLDLVQDGSVTPKQVPTAIQLTPAGRFRAVDGRPHDAKDGWLINADIAASLIQDTSALKNDLLIDYEHQTLNKEKNGQPAPAAAWFKKMEWREGSGLWAVDVKWTSQAKEAILNGEYRYLSPVFSYEPKTGRLLNIDMAAITNSPGLDGMQSLATLTQKQFNQLSNHQSKPTKEKPMKKLLKLLGLSKDATEDEAVAALTALQAAAATAETNIAALTAQVEADPDPAKFVPIEVMKDLQAQVATLTAQTNEGRVEGVVDEALKNGLLTPAQKQWAINLGKSNLVSLTEYISGQAPIAAFNGTQADDADQGKGEQQAALTKVDESVMAMFGNTPDDLAKYAG